MTHSFDFFFEFKRTHIIHASEFVDLSQGQFGLAKIAKFGLRIVLRNILVGRRTAFVKFIQNHTNIYAGAPPCGAGATAAPG